MTSHSQCGEDVWILENLKPDVGTFCEVGAYDGILSSNTLLFEELGWMGLLIEPDPFLAAQCQQNRKAPCFCCACGFKAISRWFPINKKDRGLSGWNRPGDPIPVIQIPLSELLDHSRCEDVSFLSIDTEGTELEVWQSIGNIRPRIVMLEYQTCDEPPQDKAIVERMAADGYQEVHRTQYNIIFTLR